MNTRIVQKNIITFLVAMMALLPAQVSLCQASEVDTGEIVTLSAQTKKEPVDKNKKEVTKEKKAESESSDNSSLMWVGIGAGALVVIGGAVALSGGGSGGGSDPAPIVPPTADSLVYGWHAEGRQPGSGKTYTGTFHLYAGGNLGYDIQVSSGEHFVGGGSWSISGYRLEIRTDHGSFYRGDFRPAATYVSVDLGTSSGWNVTLTR